MKKRLISVLLTVLMVMSLFSGMSLSAYADNTTTANTQKYTMANGDNVFMICQRLGINFYDCKSAIMKLNGIADGMWNKLPVGKVLTLPATNADGILLGSGGIGGTTVITGTGTGTNVAQVSATLSDPVAYYLIPYTISRGETVAGVCNQLGINFNAYAEQIKKLNGISNWTKVAAGSTLLLPSLKAPAIGTSCYAVVAHKVASGETAYSIANGKGVSYGGNTKLLQALNNTNNLNSINAGSNFYVPVATTIAPDGTATGLSSASAATTSSSSSSGSNSSSGSSSSSSTAKKYKLSTNITSSSGSLQFYVNNKAVTEASAGDKVTVVVDMNKGKALKSMTVKHLNGKGELLLTGDTFIMPSCDVRVDVEVESGYDINITANYTGKAAANVGGIAVTSAVKGTKVFIVSTDPSYEVESAIVTYKKLLGSKTEVPVTADMGFVMPDAKVNVEVKLKPVSTYDFYVNDPDHGSFFLQVNGSNVSKAAKGAQVSIVTKAQDGYEPTKIEVWRLKDDGSDDKQISVINGKFTMPGADVRVEVLFSAQGNNIVFMPAKGGSATAEVGGSTVTEADTGAEVTLVPNAESGYTLKRFDVARNSDGYKVKVTSNKFSMPNGGVTVTPVFEGAENSVTGVVFLDGTAVAEYMDCGFIMSDDVIRVDVQTSASGDFHFGDYVDLKIDSVSAIGFDHFEVYVGGASTADDELSNQANMKGYIEMPNDSVEIRGYFVSGKITIGQPVYTPSNGVCGTVSNLVDGKTVSTCHPGDTVTLKVDPGEGYYFDAANYSNKLVVTRKDTGAKITLTKVSDDTYTFVMPAEGVNIQATFDANAYVYTMLARDEAGNDLTGMGLWQILINGKDRHMDNNPGGTLVDVHYKDKITIGRTNAGGYDLVAVWIDGAEYKAKKLNNPYEFYVQGTRTKDLEILAIFRENNPVPDFYKFNYNVDWALGNAEGFILNSIYPFDSDKVVTGAHAGDTVAIVPSSTATGYTIDAEHISITKPDGSVIHPVETTLASGKTGYVFTMPAGGIKAVKLDFYPISYAVKIKVLKTSTSTDLTTLGLVVFEFNKKSISDVNTDSSIGSIPYKSTVYVRPSAVAKTNNWKIDSVALNGTTLTPKGEGAEFEMPAMDSLVEINMSGGTLPPTPPPATEVQLPSKTDSGLNLLYYKEDGITLITDGKAMSGDTVIVKVDETATPIGDGKKLKDGIHFLDSSDNEVASADNGGSFVVPATIDGSKDAKAEIVEKQYSVRIKVKNAPSEYTVKVDGVGVSADTVLSPNKKYGASIKIDVTGEFDIESVDNLTKTAGSGQTFTGNLEPAAEVEDGDVVDVTINFEKKYTVKLVFENDNGETPASVEVDSATYNDGDTLPNKYKADETISFSNASRDIAEIKGLASATASGDSGSGKVEASENDTITVTISFVPMYAFRLNVTNTSGGTFKYGDSPTLIDNVKLLTAFKFKPGDEFKIHSASREIVSIDAPSWMSINSDKMGATGTIPEGDPDGTVYDISVSLVPWAKLKVGITPSDKKLTVNENVDYWGDGDVSNYTKSGDTIVLKAPSGYVFDSISCSAAPPVDPSLVQNLGEVTIKVNNTIQDNVEYALAVVMKPAP